MRGRENLKKKKKTTETDEADTVRGQIGNRGVRERGEIRKGRSKRSREMRGYGEGEQQTHAHLAAGARKAQLVKVQGGHKEEGPERSWECLVEAALGWVGLGQWVQLGPKASRLWAPSPISESWALLCGFHR